MKNIQASGIRRVFDLAATLENPVNLSIGQPDFDVPEPVKEAAIKAIRDGHNGYTPSPGLPILRERVSAWFKSKGIQHEAVMVTAGASGGLMLSMMVLSEPGCEVLIPDPFFVSYKHLVTAAGATPVYYSTYPDFIPKAPGRAYHRQDNSAHPELAQQPNRRQLLRGYDPFHCGAGRAARRRHRV
jgi:aspartate aminotransferase/aminotransferase